MRLVLQLALELLAMFCRISVVAFHFCIHRLKYELRFKTENRWQSTEDRPSNIRSSHCKVCRGHWSFISVAGDARRERRRWENGVADH